MSEKKKEAASQEQPHQSTDIPSDRSVSNPNKLLEHQLSLTQTFPGHLV